MDEQGLIKLVKEYIPNILYGENDEHIIGIIIENIEEKIDVEELKNMIDVYRAKIDILFNSSMIDNALKEANTNINIAAHMLSKNFVNKLQLSDKSIPNYIEIYARKVVNAYWTKNQRIINTDYVGR